MKLYRAVVCRIVLQPVETKQMTVYVYANSSQSAGRLLKRQYPDWEKIEWEQINRPVTIRL